MIRSILSVILFLFILIFQASGQQFTEKLKKKLTIHFDSNSSTVHDTDQVAIKEFIDELNVVMPYVFRIQGHTDSVGSLKFNEKLAMRRTKAISDMLLDMGIPKIMIYNKGLGETKPIAENDSEEVRYINLRVNIFVFEIQRQRLFKSKIKLEGAKSNKASIYIYNDGNTDSTFSDDEGNFAFIIPENKDVTYGVFAKGYMFTTQKINTSKDLPIYEIPLKKIAKGETVALQNLYFVGDKAVLLQESVPELTNLLRFIRMNPKLKLEIGGHVNGPKSYINGDPNWYFNLAQDRANSIKQYITDHGFAESNYRSVSYSNTQMIIAEPKNEDEAKLNRRVEIRVDQ